MKALVMFALVLLVVVLPSVAGESAPAGLPPAWQVRWNAPCSQDRPLQIVHAIPADQATRERMGRYRELGLGGVVTNVAPANYLRSEEHWTTLVKAVEACGRLGLIVWLYDEEGYPSGAAGGLVLAENPAFEAEELVYDKDGAEPFRVRAAYEYAHAANNYHAARRCPNLIDARAVRSFLDKTHEAYWEHLRPHFGRTIRATFTDEPSLMAVGLGSLSEDVRKRVRVVDVPDPAVRPLPSVPWGPGLAEEYEKRFGESLTERRKSLFTGDAPEDRATRRRFWSLVATLMSEGYFGRIQQWCHDHGIASSGHSLWEENLLHQVPLEGNGLACLARMDVPGLDMLSSDPAVVMHSGWLTAALPSSAALLEGRRRVMTEASDFIQKQGGQGPAGLDAMRATAAWQAAWGVTDFTLYYGTSDRPAEEYRAYCDYVGRVNAILGPARPVRGVALYYPIHDLSEEYLPVSGPLRLDSQSVRAQQIVASFMRLGQSLQRGQMPFCLVDHDYVAAARIESGGKMRLGTQSFDSLLIPSGSRLPLEAARVVEEFRREGGIVLVDEENGAPRSSEALRAELHPRWRVMPASEKLVLGEFVRDGRRIVLVVNVGEETYEGQMTVGPAGSWLWLDPATGVVERAVRRDSDTISVRLHRHQAMLLIEAIAGQ